MRFLNTLRKRGLALLLAVLMCMTLLPSNALALDGDPPFTDMNATDWFYDAVQYAFNEGMMSGTSATTFSPNAATTRGMIVTALHRMEGTPAVAGRSFADVRAGQWYTNAVAWASANGIVSGYSNGTFGPEDAITREQMASILYRYSQKKGYDTSKSSGISEFSDAAQVSPYAVEAIQWAVGNEMISGIGNHMLAPGGNATRAQVASILMRYNKNIVASETESAEMVSDDTSASNKNTSSNGSNGKSRPHGANGSDSDTASRPVVYYYRVMFDALAGDADNIPPTQQVRSGELAVKPANPSRSGYNFEDWYLDNTYTEIYDFRTPITENITLYAKWNPNSSTEPTPGGGTGETHRVTFDLNDNSSGVYEVQMVEDGTKAQEPGSEPERELYGFTGWYEEPSGAVAYDFDSAVTDDLVLYAGWGSPDPDADGLYAASNTEETVYSISGLFMDDTGVTATVNVNSTSVLLVDFFEDTLGDQWDKNTMTALLNGTPTASVATYTPDYGELINVSIPVSATLPQYFIARARLLSSTGTDLCEPFLYIEGSRQYAEFEKKTTDDYDPDKVINFDENKTTNFGVLNTNAKEITISESTNILDVKDIDAADKLVPDHIYTFAAPDTTVQRLKQGDIVYITGTQYLFKVDSITTNADNSITIIPDEDAVLADYYEMLKVDIKSSADQGIQPMAEIIDVNQTGISTELGFPSIEVQPINWLTVTWSANFKINVDLKIIYDAKLFSEDYFEFSEINSISIETSIEAKAAPGEKGDEDGEGYGDNPLKWDPIGKATKKALTIPTPIPGLEVYGQVGIPIEVNLSGSVSLTWNGTIKNGVIYNSYTGREDIKDTEKTIKLKAEGKAELKVGPKLAVGVDFIKVVSAELNGSAGAKVSFASSISTDLTNTEATMHTCIACVAGDVKWFVEFHLKAEYDICKYLSGDLFDVTLINIEMPLALPGNPEGKFYVSVIPGPDSVFPSTEASALGMHFGWGKSCPNIAYRTELKTVDGNDAELSGIPVRVKKNTGTFDESGNSTYVVYLHDGIYASSANINGTKVSKSVIVKGNAQTVTLSPNSSDKELTGKIVDSTNRTVGIADADIKVSKDGLVITSGKSDSNGDFKISLPDGTFLVEITKRGYIPFSIYQKVENDQDSTQMQRVELIPGSGMGGFRGIITDAVTGQPINGVTLTLRSGWENSTNGDVLETLKTGSQGEFSYNTSKVPFTDIVLGLPCGNYTLTASKNGYIGTHFNITVLPGETNDHPQQNASMAPAQTDSDSWRIVLTWDENPRDLDSHVVGSLASGNRFHVYYSHKSQYDGGSEICNLDRDDTTSYGPETITLNANNSSPYYYYIYRYAGSGTVASSGAQIKVYHGADIVRTFNVPTGLGNGDYWNVFAIVDGQIVVQNTITNNADISYAGGSGIMTLALDEMGEMEDKANVPSTDEDFIGTVSNEDDNPEASFVLADAQADARTAVNEYKTEKIAALTDQDAIDAATAKSYAEAAIDEAVDQVGIDEAVAAYKDTIDTLMIARDNLETDNASLDKQR